MPAGRPSKFNVSIQKKIKKLALRGFTDIEIAEIVDIKEQTLTNWKKRYPGFFASLKDWKNAADYDIERSLYERAKGYSHPEDKIFCNNGDIVVQPTIKHYPPDPTSMIFWLKNRQPEKWRDKQEIDLTGKVDTNWNVKVVEK